MLNYRRKIAATVSIIITILLVAYFSGCSEVQTAGDAENQDSNPIYLTQNNITTELVEMENFSDNAPNQYLYTKIQVSGLADTSVQDKINASIEAEYEKLVNQKLPGYRGISALINPDDVKDYEIISMNVTGNFDNILSIHIIKKVKQSGISYVDNYALNFDLRTGDTIQLKQLFKDEDCSSLNAYVGERLQVLGNVYEGGNIHDESVDYKMISMFKGMPDDQKFYINESGIVLLMDYTNPEIYMTKYDAFDIAVGYDVFSQQLNLDAFAQTDAKIYTDTEVRYMIPYSSGKSYEKLSEQLQPASNISLSTSFVYTDGIPEAAMLKGEELAGLDNELASALRSEAAAYPNTQYGYANNVNGKKLGNYYNIVQSVSCYRANYWWDTKSAYVYDENGDLMELADLFKAGCDYEGIIKTQISEMLAADFPDSNYGGSSIDEIYAGISFYIDSYGLQIQTQPIKFNADSADKEYESSVAVFIPYEKFGCDQMTIFN